MTYTCVKPIYHALGLLTMALHVGLGPSPLLGQWASGPAHMSLYVTHMSHVLWLCKLAQATSVVLAHHQINISIKSTHYHTIMPKTKCPPLDAIGNHVFLKVAGWGCRSGGRGLCKCHKGEAHLVQHMNR
jgi:hypothetical protein